MKRIVINLKPSHRVVVAFKKCFPEAKFYGAATLGSKSKSYLMNEVEFNKNQEIVKRYGSKARFQPFL